MPEILSYEPMLPLNTDYRFVFIVIGVGGTGSQLVPHLARAIYSDSKKNGDIPCHQLILADADFVEEKNILRQNFFKSDIGRNKAEVMALKISSVFNLEVESYSQFIESHKTLDRLLHPYLSKGYTPFIIGCVDTNAVRVMLHDYVNNYKHPTINKNRVIFYLDAGNEEFAGQVVLGVRVNDSNKIQSPKSSSNFNYSSYNLPTVVDLYPDILESEDKFVSDLSCAERVVSNPQAADVNLEAANQLYKIISNCLRGKLDYHHVTFDTILGNSRTVHLTESYVKWQLKLLRSK